ncbi:hypothetical protein [Methylobacterium sp. V23]|uniref:hypothetical protein n=1 Tax=Methylobacterium sp. V23 TaxID=2044878 RepID=UPI000CDA87B1|nr:hypothetical protein [Methylobacterium sp. V23]POR41318.1 hypothetical protein CRT23_19380 [Methylobacterium sp. V23]
MMWDEPPDRLSNSGYIQMYQAQRPDTFVKKLPSRRWAERSSRASSSSPSIPTFITEKEFAEHYTAAAFAGHHDLTCETSVTLWWGALGARDGASAQRVFTQFRKHLNEWMYERHLPTVYFFGHENSQRIGLHTHLALYLCLSTHTRSPQRDEFRRWAMEWPERNGYGSCPRAIRVTGPAKRTRWLHWHHFHYQVKGYDPQAIVRRAYNSPFGTDVLLGELIAWPWQDPGVVTMMPRLGSCLNLGPARREIGIPKHCDELRNPPQPKRPVVPRVMSLGEQLRCLRQPEAPRPPFISRYEDGWRDVRWLYPREFNTRVTKLSYEPEPPRRPPPSDDFMLEIELI